MKKLLKPLIITLVTIGTILVLTTSIFAASDRVSDKADIFTGQEELTIELMTKQIYDSYGYDIVVFTNTSYNGSISSYTENYYKDHGYNQSKGGVVLYICMNPSDREYNFEYIGDFYERFGYRNNTKLLENSIMPYLKSGDYGTGVMEFVETIDMMCSNPEEYDYGFEKISYTVSPGMIVFAIIIAIIVGSIYVSVLTKEMKKVKVADVAGEYVVPGSFKQRVQRDHFLYDTVIREKIESNSSHSSGGGRSHGGGGHF